MPKNRKPARRPASTIRVAPLPSKNSDAPLQRMGSLVVVQGADVDLGRHILCDQPITIGRDVRVDFCLNDGSISRSHCRVELAPSGEGYILLDLNSTNGTTLNGQEVDCAVALETGDKVFLGSSVVRFSYSDAVDVEYHSKLEELVQTDALTGLDAKRQYDAVFAAASNRALEDDMELSVVVMDLDGLKHINDTHGHEMGSFAIAETANLIREVMGNSHGHLARFGGDEFVCCFPGLGFESSMRLAEKLRKRIEEHVFQKDDIVIAPTMSIGVATYPVHSNDPKQLFSMADEALYRAKRAGKNRVEGAMPTEVTQDQ